MIFIVPPPFRIDQADTADCFLRSGEEAAAFRFWYPESRLKPQQVEDESIF
jgi:hypothetical protein